MKIKKGAVNCKIVENETLLNSIVLKYVYWTKYIPAVPNKIIPIKSFLFFNGFKIDFFSIKMTTIKSNIPEINVLIDTSQSDEKLYFLNKISPEIPDMDHRLEANPASSIPCNFIFSFIAITLQNFLYKKNAFPNNL